jgi:hypothetical protein
MTTPLHFGRRYIWCLCVRAYACVCVMCVCVCLLFVLNVCGVECNPRLTR